MSSLMPDNGELKMDQLMFVGSVKVVKVRRPNSNLYNIKSLHAHTDISRLARK